MLINIFKVTESFILVKAEYFRLVEKKYQFLATIAIGSQALKRANTSMNIYLITSVTC